MRLGVQRNKHYNLNRSEVRNRHFLSWLWAKLSCKGKTEMEIESFDLLFFSLPLSFRCIDIFFSALPLSLPFQRRLLQF